MEEIFQRSYEVARETYGRLGVDTEAALVELADVHLSIHCWQGDDVGGFETPHAELSGGGIQATGNHPGKARNASELREDLEKALSLVPGNHRVNLHAIYGEFGGKRVDRDEIDASHFREWIDWAAQHTAGLDFNATLFSHPLAEDGFTLSHRDDGVRDFWIEHVNKARAVAAHMGRKLSTPSVHNLWIPDGSKDLCVDKMGYRERLMDSLEKIYAWTLSPDQVKDAVESKLFGIGAESFTVGSHDFYLPFAVTRGIMPCLDTGHFHPTESVGDKISAVLLFSRELLLHVSRGVRWDSDHVAILGDDLRELALEVVRARARHRVHIALDFFDASINRVGAWVTGARATLKALLAALLEPRDRLLEAEEQGSHFERLALLEEAKSLPLGGVWDEFCRRQDCHPAETWIPAVLDYEKRVLADRDE